MNATPNIRIATRASQLAMAQAEMVRDQLLAAHSHLSEANITLHPMTTSGDKQQEGHLAQWGYKGLFTKEVEDALLANEADIAVHSMKDMPSELPEGLMIAAITEREDARDAFISKRYASLDDLTKGATFGTSSVRRGAIIKRLRPDLNIIPFRGNVQTRMQKLEDGVADATLLAVAGLNRLGMQSEITQALATSTMLPAVAQGAVGIECRSNDAAIRQILAAIDHHPTHQAILCERALLICLDGSCKTPLSGYATIQDEQITLHAQLIMPDGSDAWELERSGALVDLLAIGRELGEELKSIANPECFA